MTVAFKSVPPASYREAGVLTIEIPKWRFGALLTWVRGDRALDPPLDLDLFPKDITENELYVFKDVCIDSENPDTIQILFDRLVQTVHPPTEEDLNSRRESREVLVCEIHKTLADDYDLHFSKFYLEKLCEERQWIEKEASVASIISELSLQLQLKQ